jgi:Flp pilus assembly pilin Flp
MNRQEFAINHCLFEVARRPAMRFRLGGIKLDQNGATAIEYAMVAFFISIAAFSAIATIGTDVTGVFSQIANSF